MTKPADAPSRRPLGRRIGIIVYAVFTGLVVVALIAAGFVVYTIQRSFPQLEGTVAVDGLGASVTVQRDERGIPVVSADDTDDLFFAQGYVHAQDRFWEMDFRRHVTSGRLSELFGESQLGTDAFLRTLGWRVVAEEEVRMLDDTARGYYDAYADGVNAYLADHDGADASFEYAILGLQNPDYEIEPWTAADSVAWLKAMAWDLRTNLEEETDRALLAVSYDTAELEAVYPSYPFDLNPVIVPQITELPAGSPAPAALEWREVEDVVAATAALVGDAGEGIGSNSWVVSGSLTESGSPLLANDPHLGAALPGVWHQMGLRCRAVTAACPFDVAGFGFSGVPGIIIGHNAQIAWGLTNLTTDVADLYVERVEGDAYERDGQLVPFEERTETLRVAGGDDVELVIRSTVHGPVVSGLTPDFTAIADARTGGEHVVALRWTALDPGTTASAVFALNVAQDFDGFRRAASLFDVPAQNLVYADVDGNIGYQTPGRLPIRGAGDGWLPQPGWDSAYDWEGFLPFEELPVVLNPAEGYIVTANNAVVGDDYRELLTRDWDYGYRAARIVDLLERASANAALTVDDMIAIQADAEFHAGKRLIAALDDVSTGEAGPDAALALLEGWDAQNDADSAAAAYANVLWDELVTDLFVTGRDVPLPARDHSRLFLVVDRLLDDPSAPEWSGDRDAMLDAAAVSAYDRLVAIQGEDPTRWNWGGLHALPLVNESFGTSGIPAIEMLFNRGPYPVGGGASVVNATGWDIGTDFATVTVPSMRMVVDLSDFDASRWNHLTGNSGHAFHPNYIDQVADWQSVTLRPWLFSPGVVSRATTHTLTLTPAD